jgi:hypothetical protein
VLLQRFVVRRLLAVYPINRRLENPQISGSQVDQSVAQIAALLRIYYQTLVPDLSTREYFFVACVSRDSGIFFA